MPTPSQIARSVRLILGDYNYWPASEGDSPLVVKTKKGVVDEAAALKLDAAMRRKEREDDTPNYVVPTDRTVQTKMLDEVLKPMIVAAGNEVSVLVEEIEETNGAIAPLEMPAEKLEFLVQLHGAYTVLQNPRILMVKTAAEPLVGMLLVGETPIEGAIAPAPTSASIIAQALLVQT